MEATGHKSSALPTSMGVNVHTAHVTNLSFLLQEELDKVSITSLYETIGQTVYHTPANPCLCFLCTLRNLNNIMGFLSEIHTLSVV